MKIALRTMSIAIAFYCALAGAQSAAERQRLQDLDQRCYKAREAKLKVLRAQKVEECVKVDRKSKADCEKWIDPAYGWGGPTGMGGTTPRFFHDIPECLEAQKAWQDPEQYRR
jgi:hypothetical protein